MKCRAYGMTVADTIVLLLVVVAVLQVTYMVLLAYQRERRHEIRMRCGRNLSQIGKAMATYANDYDGVLPAAGGPETVWASGLADWKAESRDSAFGLDANDAGGQATVSASLYLLVKYAETPPELFVCPKDKGTSEFRPQSYSLHAKALRDIWDFGSDPARHCSYAYHMPYSPYRLTTSSEPSMAVAADRNPWIDGPRQKAAPFSAFEPDLRQYNGTAEQGCHGNSQVHRSRYGHDGQNVLYLDGHVEFAGRAFCSYEDDNIYTSWDNIDKMRGLPPKPYDAQPAHRLDSLLVNDPPVGR